MERLFENQHTHSKEYYRELYLKTLPMSPPFLVVMGVLAVPVVMSIVRFFLALLSSESFPTFSAILAFSAIIFMWLMLSIIVRMLVKKSCNAEFAVNNGKFVEANLIATDDGIAFQRINCENQNHLTFPYDEIKQVIKTKNYCLVVDKNSACHAFKHDSFIKGTPEAFLLFLRNKGFKC